MSGKVLRPPIICNDTDTPRRIKYVLMGASFLIEIMRQGKNFFFGVSCVEGVPESAVCKFVSAKDADIWILFECDEFPEVAPGEVIPWFTPQFNKQTTFEVFPGLIFEGAPDVLNSSPVRIIRDAREVRVSLVGKGDERVAGRLAEEVWEFSPREMSLREQAGYLQGDRTEAPNSRSGVSYPARVRSHGLDVLEERSLVSQLSIPASERPAPSHPVDIYIGLEPPPPLDPFSLDERIYGEKK